MTKGITPKICRLYVCVIINKRSFESFIWLDPIFSSAMDWRAIWTITTGLEPQTPYVPPYVASLVFFFINMVIGVGLRTMSRVLLPSNVRGHVLDFLCTMEACAYFFENNFVVKHYGYTWLAVAIIAQLYVCSRTFGDNIDNPVKAFHGWLVGESQGRSLRSR